MMPKKLAPAKAGVADFSDKIMRKINENCERRRFNVIEKRSSIRMPRVTDNERKLQDNGDFTEADEPLRLFAAWFADARKAEPNDPEAMALATVDSGGLPNLRMVLLKGFDERGFVFYS